MKIAILANSPSSLQRWENESLSDQSVENTASQVSSALAENGHQTVVLLVDDNPEKLISSLKFHNPEVVFNLCETIGGDSTLEPAVPYLLKWLRIPFTGNGPEALALAFDKPRAKIFLQASDFPTPEFLPILQEGQIKLWNNWPAILKPAQEDASLGIDEGSVVTDFSQAISRFKLLEAKFGTPILMESYINGREINAAVLETPTGLKVGLNEIDFSTLPANKPKIVTYEAKWLEDSLYFKATPVKSPALIDEPLNTQIRELAKSVFQAFDLSGYARVDFRISESGKPFILEINPNPDFSQDAGFARSLSEMGLSYSDAAEIQINMALRKFSQNNIKRI
ncbi:MAG: ATP-grasp domain-containing protein [Candidatus Riflebacteria bacterium]|nr:ATP-grasp domain-containing protein [Candidatus Riflebacteria bacterium]